MGPSGSWDGNVRTSALGHKTLRCRHQSEICASVRFGARPLSEGDAVETSEVRRDDVDGVVTVTFTRDAKMNAVTPAMFDVLAEAVRDLGDQDDLRVLVIAAEGRYFTSGLDYASLRTNVGE